MRKAADLLKGKGCKKCESIARGIKKRMTTEEFIRRAKSIHGDKYDYSKTVYVSNKHKLIVTCPNGHDFETNPKNHISGRHECSECANSKYNCVDHDSFIRISKSIHGDKYDYKKVKYKTTKTNVLIKCKVWGHGYFPQKPEKHILGRGCPKCAGQQLDYLPYEEAKLKIRLLALKFSGNTSKEYRMWWKENKNYCQRLGLPANPHVYYKTHV